MKIQELPRCVEIGEYIIQNADDITEEWVRESIQWQPHTATAHREMLVNSMPDFLRELGNNLLGGDTRIPNERAAEHGLQRWQINWELESVIRDYTLLRVILINRVRRDIPHCMEDVIGIALAIDNAVAASVLTYVSHASRQLLAANRRLATANAQLGEFAHVVAHELRNPLASAQMSADSLKTASPAQAPQWIDRLQESLDMAKRIVRNLLAFAKADAPELEKGPVDLNETMDKIRTALAGAIERREARVENTALPTVNANEPLLRLVLKNLIENAIKYTQGQAPQVMVSSEERPEQFLISVSDMGVGIPPDMFERIFEFAVRAHDDRTAVGTGIGLAFCRRVIERHGGRIWVNSKPGLGSTFSFTLPKEGVARGSPQPGPVPGR